MFIRLVGLVVSLILWLVAISFGVQLLGSLVREGAQPDNSAPHAIGGSLAQMAVAVFMTVLVVGLAVRLSRNITVRTAGTRRGHETEERRASRQIASNVPPQRFDRGQGSASDRRAKEQKHA
jgi:hypothetical protein